MHRLPLVPVVVLALTVAVLAGEPPEVRRLGALVLDGVPEIPERIVERTNQYQNVRWAEFRDWSPGGAVLCATRFGETVQLHLVSAPGGARRQLTFYREPTDGGSFGDDPDWFLFNRDWGGNEVSQIFRFDLVTGRDVLLTDGEGRHGEPLWSNARDRIAYRSTARNGRDWDVWVMDPLRPEGARLVLEGEGFRVPVDWSPDDSKLLVIRFLSINESYLWVVDVESGEKTPFGRHDPGGGETVLYGAAVFDGTGDGIFFACDEGTEFATLRHGRIGRDDDRELTGDIPWNVETLVTSPDRTRLAFTVNDDGRDKLWWMDTTRREREQVELPDGIIETLGFDRDGRRLAITLESPAGPRDVHVIDVRSGLREQWTHSEVGGLDTREFRRSELVRFPTFDADETGARRTIPAFVYRPAGEGPSPVVIRIHGGPEDQSRAHFSYTSQYELAELGCAVIYPNVRGSSGYGKTFVKLDNGRRREDAVRDIGALLDWIAAQPELDETRVALTGGSYGGYLVLASMIRYGDRIRCGVDRVGISDFVTFLENTADYRRDLRRVEYGDERDEEMRSFLQSISPTTRAAGITAPLFVVQGANDPRVPASEAEQIVAAVRANGRDVWYMLAEDEGHGFRKKGNLRQMAYANALFWEMYLLDEKAGPRATR